MRALDALTHPAEPFAYYCPVCGAQLSRANFETIETEYSCPQCGTGERASRIAVR